MKKPAVSIIIATKNEEINISRSLASCMRQTGKYIELIVIDNFSDDQTLTLAQKFTSETYLKGYERSRQKNYGAGVANGQYLLFVDADMELEKGLVEECLNLSAGNNFEAIIIPEKIPEVDFWTKARNFEKSLYHRSTLYEAPRFFRRETFLSLGGYDENLVASEDWDIANRARDKKIKIGYAGHFLIHHEGPISLVRLAQKKFYYGLNLKYFFAKNPKRSFAQYNPIRKVFFNNTSKIVRNMPAVLGLVILKTIEYTSGGLGFIIGILNK